MFLEHIKNSFEKGKQPNGKNGQSISIAISKTWKRDPNSAWHMGGTQTVFVECMKTQLAHKHMKRYPTSLVIREIKMKMTMGYHFILTILEKIKIK